ncbi:MAG: AAA family ATPase [Muribaculaceae bacterium]
MTNFPADIDTDNREFRNALRLISDTRQSVFLTGKAGTGKSTFLKYICDVTRKKYIVLAPTGIAAVNVGGMTIHSFFKMPLKPMLPDDPDYMPRKIRKTLRYTKEKVRIIKELDLIIIDEISMVRADMIDFMDKVLRVYSENMREPFGGKQLLLVGDIFQLEPVVTPDMRDILRRYYNDFFFFNARAFSAINIVPIELVKIYRQSDSNFISMLDKIRVNQVTERDIQLINTRFQPAYESSTGDFVMTLATRRDTVDTINESHLAEIEAEEHTFKGLIEGTFPLQNLPTSQELTLKVGAQVIFIRNDRSQRWINGTIGKVSEIGDDFIEVELESGKKHSLQPEQWENMQYDFDEKEKRIKETVLGTFTQFPVKLAWALTIHKSQGLTFNNIIIDLSGGAFSSGQTYVALSRCTSLSGIILRQPIRLRDIIVNRSVVEFSKSFNSNALISDALNRANAYRCFVGASHAFDNRDFSTAIDSFVEANRLQNVLDEPLFKRFLRKKLNVINVLQHEIDRLTDVVSEKTAILNDLATEFALLGNALIEDTHLEPIGIKSAMANFNKALGLNQACLEALLGKAELLVRLDEAEEAVALLKKATEAHPDSDKAFYWLGQCRLELNDYPGALIALKKSIRLNGGNPEAHDALCGIYTEIGLDDMAEKHRKLADKLRKKK